jgi:hypothetical protein
VDLRLGHPVAEGAVAELADHYDAVVAAGASMPLRLPVDGAALDGAWDATRFLTEVHSVLAGGDGLEELRRLATTGSGGPKEGADGPIVLVLGAGNTAMDVARSARRVGAQAVCVDWMDRRFAPVRPDELEEAAAEGVDVRFSTTLERLAGEDGRVATAHLAPTRQQSAGERPEVVRGQSAVLRVDMVVMAMGYRIEPELAESVGGVTVSKSTTGVPDRRWRGSGILANAAPEFARHQPVGRLAIGREHARAVSGLARRNRIWVAGDALVGPSTVVEAMSQGKHAAQAIIHHRPRRQGSGAGVVRRVLVAVEGASDAAVRCATELGRAIHERRGDGSTVAPTAPDGAVDLRVVPIDKVTVDSLAWADALVVGVHVAGPGVGRPSPARSTRARLQGIAPLAGMPVAIFCTYSILPGSTMATLRSEIEAIGGQVVAAEAIPRRQIAGSNPPAGITRIADALVGGSGRSGPVSAGGQPVVTGSR